MSFGDGLAQSKGVVGSNKICYVADGTTIVNNSIGNPKMLKYISPSSDCKSYYNKTTKINNQLAINKIQLNGCTKFVSYNVDNPLILYANKDVSTIIDQATVYSSLYSKTCQVIDSNDENKYIFQYLNLTGEKVSSPVVPIIFYKKDVNITYPKYVLSKDIETNTQKYNLGTIETKVIARDGLDDSRTIFNCASVFVEDKQSYNKNSVTIITPVTAIVEDYKPPNIGVIAFSGGGGLKGFRLVVQKNSYFEHYLGFNSGSVVDVTGLPPGMICEKGFLKGSPTISGNFIVSIKMDDATALSGLLIVTQVPRQL
jgi:hypothetical protein